MTMRPSCLTNIRLTPGLLATIFAGAFFLLAAPGFAQTPAATLGAAANTQSKTLWKQIKEGGWVMFPIAVCLIATLYLIGDGVIRTSRKKAAPPEQEEALKTLFRQGDYVGAHSYCKENVSPLTNVLRVGISLLGEGKQAAEEGMLGALAKENSHVQTYISYLSVIGVCTPP